MKLIPILRAKIQEHGLFGTADLLGLSLKQVPDLGNWYVFGKIPWYRRPTIRRRLIQAFPREMR